LGIHILPKPGQNFPEALGKLGKLGKSMGCFCTTPARSSRRCLFELWLPLGTLWPAGAADKIKWRRHPAPRNARLDCPTSAFCVRECGGRRGCGEGPGQQTSATEYAMGTAVPLALVHRRRSGTRACGGTLAPSTMAYQLASAMPLVHWTSLRDPGMRRDPGAKHDGIPVGLRHASSTWTSLRDPGMRRDPGAKHDGIPVGLRHASSTGMSLRDIDSTLAAGRREVGLESSPGCRTRHSPRCGLESSSGCENGDFTAMRSRVEPRMQNTAFTAMRSRVEPRMQNTAFTMMRSRVELRMRKTIDFTTMRSRV
jgi:hypothetical protein